MKNIRVFLSENFQFLEVKFSIYLNRHVLVMILCPYSIFVLKSEHLPFTTVDAVWVENRVDADQTPISVASDLDLHCLSWLVCPNIYGNYGTLCGRSVVLIRHVQLRIFAETIRIFSQLTNKLQIKHLS